MTGADAHSGVIGVRWRLGTSGTFTEVVGAGERSRSPTRAMHTLETQMVDGVGHETGSKPSTVRIDTTAPVNQTQVADPAWTTAPGT